MATVTRDQTTPADNQACSDRQRRPIISTHPDFRCKYDDYNLIEDCLKGERRIKERDTTYLPKTSAQAKSDAKGTSYEAYKLRSVYYNYPKDTLDAAVGMLQREPAVFEPFPDEMEPLLSSATVENEPLSEVLADINEGQVSFGGYCILVDIPFGGEAAQEVPVPYLVKYSRRDMINWYEERENTGRNRLRMVTLDESRYEIEAGGQHMWDYRYRICALDENGDYWTAILNQGQIASLDPKTFNPPDDLGDIDPYPNHRGTKLKYIPFVPINVSDLMPRPQSSPILDICDLSLSIYRREADRSQALFMQGQATPWMTGVQDDDIPQYLGSTQLLTSRNPDSKFGFMEVGGEGLGEMREDIDDLKNTVVSKGVSLVDTSQSESGKALAIRSSSKTSFLKTIALTGAEGLALALAYAYAWMRGIDPSEVTEDVLGISPNLDFVDDDNSAVADDLLKLIQSYQMGAPLSLESIHAWAAKKELTAKTFDDEMADRNGDQTVI